MTLREKLIKENKNKWLDIGCNRNFEEGFYYLDILPKKNIPSKYRKRYFKINVLNATKKELKTIGKFDLVRMQHVIEHFSYEEGKIVVKNIAKLFKKYGYLIITAPDLRINVKKYLKNEYKKWRWTAFKRWAIRRIPKDAPASLYFSVFAYDLPHHPHKWCYDYEGLKYLLKSSGFFRNIKELKFNSSLASFPFTHNRPEVDVCIIARRI